MGLLQEAVRTSKKYAPEVAAVGLAEATATVMAVKSSAEGNPLNVNELVALYGFATFYVGVPAAIVLGAIKNLYTQNKEAKNKPQE